MAIFVGFEKTRQIFIERNDLMTFFRRSMKKIYEVDNRQSVEQLSLDAVLRIDITFSAAVDVDSVI